MKTLPKTPSIAVRLGLAAAAAIVVWTLFGAVVSIAEPQRSVLIAKGRQLEQQGAASQSLAALALPTAGRPPRKIQ